LEKDTASYTIEEINDISRHHTVTHAILKYDILPNINTLFPHITHLRLCRVDKDANWTRYNTTAEKCYAIFRVEFWSCFSSKKPSTAKYCASIYDLILILILHQMTESHNKTELKIYVCMFLCHSIRLLENLEVLNISENNLSEGLPDNIFTSLLSLRELNMWNCRLTTLPSRFVLYCNVEGNS